MAWNHNRCLRRPVFRINVLGWTNPPTDLLIQITGIWHLGEKKSEGVLMRPECHSGKCYFCFEPPRATLGITQQYQQVQRVPQARGIWRQGTHFSFFCSSSSRQSCFLPEFKRFTNWACWQKDNYAGPRSHF